MKGPALAALLVLVFAAACSRDRGVQAAEGPKGLLVKTEAAQVRDVRRQVDVIGTLAAREEVVVSAEVAGPAPRPLPPPGDPPPPGAPPPARHPPKLHHPPAGQRRPSDPPPPPATAAGTGA